MFKSKYSKALTVILIILILAIIIIATIIGVRVYRDYEDDIEREKIYAELKEREIKTETEIKQTDSNIATSNYIIPTFGDNEQTENEVNNSNTNSNSNLRQKVKTYKNYPVIGYIKIDKTKVSYPILLDSSEGALDTAVSAIYPTNPELNTPGNVLIIGHNYRNNKFFSKNKYLAIGDKIEITDLTGKTLTYTIYEIFETIDVDTSYLTRDRGNNIEISLSTCTDDGANRLIILARVQ